MSDTGKNRNEELDEITAAIGGPTRPLGMVITQLRSVLAGLRDEAKDKDLQFQVGEIEVELQVGITAKAGGEIGFDCWLYKAKGTAEIDRASTQTVKLKLTPVWSQGGSTLIQSNTNLPPLQDHS